jgi:DMSO reductase anchor subunit
MPTWNTWRTMAGFFITALLLGQMLMVNVLAVESKWTGINLLTILPWGIMVVLLAGELWLARSAKENPHRTANKLRAGLIVGAIVGAGIMFLVPNLTGVWIGLPIFLVVVFEEIIGRRLFYATLQERVL